MTLVKAVVCVTSLRDYGVNPSRTSGINRLYELMKKVFIVWAALTILTNFFL